jgi:hypothetical protein
MNTQLVKYSVGVLGRQFLAFATTPLSCSFRATESAQNFGPLPPYFLCVPCLASAEGCYCAMPDICARTLYRTAKSFSPRP